MNQTLTSNNNKDAILIVGGCGVVGQQIAQLIRQRHPDLKLIIGERNLPKAEIFVQELKNASAILMDVDQINPLQGLKPRAILAIVNDKFNYLLMDAVHNGIPYLDITRWSERLKETVSSLSKKSLKAPVLLSSGWMAGIASVFAADMSCQLKEVNSIDISVLYSLKDKAGPNSVEYMDNLARPFEVTIDGERKQVYPYTDSRKITFPSGYTTKVYRFDTPDQITLPMTVGAKTVSTRIAFDDAMTTGLLVFLVRSGIWKLISGKFFTNFRRAILYNPGNGANHEIVIEVTGVDENKNPKTICTTILDPKGQTHLAALGALIQFERLLGLDGALSPAPGIIYPDTAPQINSAFKVLCQFGVVVTMS